jgi:hypothetical protein
MAYLRRSMILVCLLAEAVNHIRRVRTVNHGNVHIKHSPRPAVDYTEPSHSPVPPVLFLRC